jgi:uncharacterized protein (UPF0147 family)
MTTTTNLYTQMCDELKAIQTSGVQIETGSTNQISVCRKKYLNLSIDDINIDLLEEYKFTKVNEIYDENCTSEDVIKIKSGPYNLYIQRTTKHIYLIANDGNNTFKLPAAHMYIKNDCKESEFVELTQTIIDKSLPRNINKDSESKYVDITETKYVKNSKFVELAETIVDKSLPKNIDKDSESKYVDITETKYIKDPLRKIFLNSKIHYDKLKTFVDIYLYRFDIYYLSRCQTGIMDFNEVITTNKCTCNDVYDRYINPLHLSV